MEPLKTSISSLLLAVLSGFILFFSFPKFGTGWAAWISLIPLLLTLEGKSPKQSLILGFVTGLVCHIGLIYWITIVVVQYGYLPFYMGLAAMLFVAAYLSLYTGFFALGVSFLRNRNVPVILTAPVLWTSLEYVKSQILTGFPWENLGYSQYQFLPLIQISDILGVYGVSFLIVFINALLYDMVSSPFQKKIVAIKVTAGMVIIGAVLFYGFYRLEGIKGEVVSRPVQEVTLIQGNVDQNAKWNPQFQKQTMEDYSSLTLQSAPTGRRLIVWPETAVPFFFQDKDQFHEAIIGLARRTNSWLLFGSPSYQVDRSGMTLFNSAYLILPDGTKASKYDKVHLVPYGEYVPLRRIFPFISKLVQGVGDFGTGKGYVPLPMDGHKVGVLICYEGIFPEAGRTYKNNGADLLVNITNDAWFGHSSAPYQHLSMTVFRAVENRLYLVRAANTGITAIIDPTGRIVSQTGLFEKTYLQGTVRYMKSATLYGFWGDAFVLACGVILVLLIMIAVKRRKIK